MHWKSVSAISPSRGSVRRRRVHSTDPALRIRTRLASYAVSLVSTLAKETSLSTPLVATLLYRRRRCRVVRHFRTRPESTHSRPTVKYGSNEARQRVSDNVGCGGAYYRIMRPTFNNTPLLDRARSCASIIPRSLSLFSPSALSVPISCLYLLIRDTSASQWILFTITITLILIFDNWILLDFFYNIVKKYDRICLI